jgi:hypothetical protein
LSLRDDLHWERAERPLFVRRACSLLGGLLLLSACGGDERPPIRAANDPANPQAPEAPLRPAPTTLLHDIAPPASASPDAGHDPHHHHHGGKDDSPKNSDKKEER